MNIENLIQVIKSRPGMFMSEPRLEYLYYFISGFLFEKFTNDKYDKIDWAFKYNFHDWVRQWIEDNKYVKLDKHHNYLMYINSICENQEKCIEIFLNLCEQFFIEVHNEE